MVFTEGYTNRDSCRVVCLIFACLTVCNLNLNEKGGGGGDLLRYLLSGLGSSEADPETRFGGTWFIILELKEHLWDNRKYVYWSLTPIPGSELLKPV